MCNDYLLNVLNWQLTAALCCQQLAKLERRFLRWREHREVA
jgi:hypothetical protein